MTFISVKYILFLIFSVVIYYFTPKKFKWCTLLACSYLFYFLSSKFLLIYLLASTISIYGAGLLIDRENLKVKLLGKDLEKDERKIIKNEAKKHKKLVVLGTILINFGILVVLKYSGFFGKNLNQLLGLVHLKKWNIVNFVLPLGISYYTLMAISYVVDVYRGKYKAEENFGKLALFLSFFPQMVEGPIAKFDYMSKQLCEGNKFDLENIIKGSTFIMIGVFKKLVIADRAGIYVNNIFGTDTTGFTMFFGAILYTLQIYAEFSGCMDIVMGSANLFGINVLENFKRPFFSRSIQEFWRRWHITLGTWIKDYIFYPISLSGFNTKVCTFFKNHFPKGMAKFLTVAFPLLFVWLFNGIWHGASWKYIAYGMYYYILIMVGILLTPHLEKIRKIFRINKENILYKIYEIIRTSFFVVIGMMLFRSHSLITFINIFKNLFKKVNNNIFAFGLNTFDYIILLIYIIVIMIVGILQEKNIKIYDSFKNKNLLIKYPIYIFAILTIVLIGIYGEGYDAANFIYGQF